MFDVHTKEIFSYIDQSLAEENFRKFWIRLRECKSCFSGDLIFVGVKGRDHNGFFKMLDLAVKIVNKERGQCRTEQRAAFRKEIFFFTKILPLMERYQFQRLWRYSTDCLPICYYTISTDEEEVVIFNDWTRMGYTERDRKLPMNFSHLQVILYHYAKLHAVSFALRKHKPDDLETAMRNFKPLNKHTFLRIGVREKFDEGFEEVCNLLRITNSRDLFEKYTSVIGKGASKVIEDVLEDVPEEWVFTHGDGWNDNFLFKYKGDDRASPNHAIITNWQFSTPHSPVLDLSLLLYSVCSKIELSFFDELLSHYYGWLVYFLSSLDCSADTLFPFHTLMEHWKKYSSYALVLVSAGLPIIMYGEDGDGSGEKCHGQDRRNTSNSKFGSRYEERILGVVEHFCNLYFSQ
ncbi:hypothetical protein JTB14_004455 [Gonioctena quinquepunctata]|nr:hypothetical protein JTB14_004455 [Gonioctena quinquepunctata]